MIDVAKALATKELLNSSGTVSYSNNDSIQCTEITFDKW